MRHAAVRCLAGLLIAGSLPGLAMAGAKVVVHTTNYDIAGDSGKALVAAMDQSGPRHGFTTRAIARTSYTLNWDYKTEPSAGGCRLLRADGTLDLTYQYPRVTSKLSPALRKRWQVFFAGVRAHEETHGRIARQMVAAGERSVSGLNLANDPQCIKTRREAERRTAAATADYEARQVAFDMREHSPGGHVQKLVTALQKAQ